MKRMLIVASLTALAAAACADAEERAALAKSDAHKGAHNGAHKDAHERAHDHGDGDVHTVKPGAGLRFTSSLSEAKIEPGARARATVTIAGPPDGSAVLRASADAGLALSPAAPKTRLDFSVDGEASWDLYFTAGAPGRHYLKIVAETEDGLAQTYAIAVPVGETGLRARKGAPDGMAMEASEDGRMLVVAPADETISQD